MVILNGMVWYGFVAYSPGTGFPDLAGKFPNFPKTREFPGYSPFLFPVPVFHCSPLLGICSPNYVRSHQFSVPRNSLVYWYVFLIEWEIKWFDAPNNLVFI